MAKDFSKIIRQLDLAAEDCLVRAQVHSANAFPYMNKKLVCADTYRVGGPRFEQDNRRVIDDFLYAVETLVLRYGAVKQCGPT